MQAVASPTAQKSESVRQSRTLEAEALAVKEVLALYRKRSGEFKLPAEIFLPVEDHILMASAYPARLLEFLCNVKLHTYPFKSTPYVFYIKGVNLSTGYFVTSLAVSLAMVISSSVGITKIFTLLSGLLMQTSSPRGQVML